MNNTSLMQEDTKEEFINPIDERKIAKDPSLLPYAHTVGGAVIKPTEQGHIKGKAMLAMEQQTDKQLGQLYDQMKILADQAKAIQERIMISAQIYESEMGFEPIIGHTYYLYLRKNGKLMLSMIGPDEWGRNFPFEEFRAKVSLLADHTWEVL